MADARLRNIHTVCFRMSLASPHSSLCLLSILSMPRCSARPANMLWEGLAGHSKNGVATGISMAATHAVSKTDLHSCCTCEVRQDVLTLH